MPALAHTPYNTLSHTRGGRTPSPSAVLALSFQTVCQISAHHRPLSSMF